MKQNSKPKILPNPVPPQHLNDRQTAKIARLFETHGPDLAQEILFAVGFTSASPRVSK